MYMLATTLSSKPCQKRTSSPAYHKAGAYMYIPAQRSVCLPPLCVVGAATGGCKATVPQNYCRSLRKICPLCSSVPCVYRTAWMHTGFLLGELPYAWGLEDLLANAVGCFVMGCSHLPADAGSRNYDKVQPAVQRIRQWHQSHPAATLSIRTGFCGALTTFSGWCALQSYRGVSVLFD